MSRAPIVAAWTIAAVVAIGLAASVYRIPIQVDDSLDVIVRAANSSSPRAAFVEALYQSNAMLRPLKEVRAWLLVDASEALGGRYHLVFRGYHAAAAVVLIALFTWVARPREWRDVAALSFALTVLTGSALFVPLLREAYPVNHFLVIVIYALAMLALARSRGGWSVDVAAALMLVIAVLTLESGVLLWPLAVAAYIAGWRGISRTGLAAITLCLAGYAVLRVGYLDIGGSDIGVRTTGFGAGALSAAEQIERFGDNPAPLYAYNVMMGALSVLLSQPESGQWTIVAAWRDGAVPPVLLVGLLSSLATTGLIAAYAFTTDESGRRRWREPIPFVAAVVLVCNAVIGYGYLKPDVMSVAAAFYALAAYVAARQACAMRRRGAAALTAVVLLALTSSGWAVRSAGLHFKLAHGAFDARGGWAHVLKPQDRSSWPPDAEDAELVARIKQEAISRTTTAATTLSEVYQTWWGED